MGKQRGPGGLGWLLLCWSVALGTAPARSQPTATQQSAAPDSLDRSEAEQGKVQAPGWNRWQGSFSAEEVEIERQRAAIAQSRLERAERLARKSAQAVDTSRRQVADAQRSLAAARARPDTSPSDLARWEQELAAAQQAEKAAVAADAQAQKGVLAAQQERAARQRTAAAVDRLAKGDVLKAEAARVAAAVEKEKERYAADKQQAETILRQVQTDLETAQAELEAATATAKALAQLQVAVATARQSLAQSQIERADERLLWADLRLSVARRRAEIAEQREALGKRQTSRAKVHQQALQAKQKVAESDLRILLLKEKRGLVQDDLRLLGEADFSPEQGGAAQGGAEGASLWKQIRQAHADRQTVLQDLLAVLQAEERLANESREGEADWEADAGARDLWHRRVQNVSGETWRVLLADVREGLRAARGWIGTLPGRAGAWWSEPEARRRGGWVILAALAAGVFFFLMNTGPLRLLAQYCVRLAAKTEWSLAERWLGALSRVGLNTLQSTFVLGGLLFMVQAAQVRPNLGRALWRLAILLLLYRLARNLIRELLSPYRPERRPLRCSDSVALYAHAWLSRLLLGSVLFLPALGLLTDLGYARDDVLALVGLAYRTLLLLLVLLAIAQPRSLLHFLPRADAPRVQVAVRLLHPLAIAYLLFLFIMNSLGYVNFANYCFVGTALSVAALGLIPMVHRLFHRLLVWGVSRLDSDRTSVPVEGSPARWLYHHLRPGVPYLTGFLAAVAIFQSWGLSATGLVAWFLKDLWHVLHLPFNPQSKHPVSVWSILLAVVYVVAAFLISKHLRRALERFVYSNPRLAWDRGIQHAVSTTVHYAAIAFGALKCLQSLGLTLADLTVLSAAFGVGLGFGLQDIFKNFISGAIMLVERPIKIGDYVNVAGTLGNVTNISTRSTTITTADDTALIVPNATFITTNVINWSHGERTAKLHVPVNVTNQVDMATVRETMLRVLDGVEGLVAEPAPQVLCTALTGGGFSFDLQVWTRTPERSQEIVSQINFALESAFREAGIELK